MGLKLIKPADLIAGFQKSLKEKWGYIYGALYEMWSEAKQAAYAKKYKNDPKRKLSVENGGKWVGHIVTDCSGLFTYWFEVLGGKMYHGSNTMYISWCTAKGTLKNGKKSNGEAIKPGTAVFCQRESDGVYSHVGLYVGGGYVIEAAGTNQGVCRSKLTNKKWEYWGELKGVDYSDTPADETPDEPVAPTYPTLREGAKGEMVVQLQDLLAKAGSNLKIDGIFGPGTRSAVRAFQKKYGLVVDGIVGPKTWKKLLEVAGNIKIEEPEPEKLVTLLIPDLKKADAEALKKKYPRAEEITV